VNVAFNHLQAALGPSPRQLHHASQRLRGAVGVVVEHHKIMACLQQHQAGVAADEALATRESHESNDHD
jgi:hypothetical protein